MRYFFFGTLMDRGLLAVILGRELPDEAFSPARLSGFARQCVRGEAFPTLVPCADGGVEGVLVRDLTPADAARIAWYETDDYEIRETAVADAAGDEIEAFCCLPRHTMETDGRAWSFETWCRDDRPQAVWLAREWMAEFGSGDVERAERNYQARKRRFLGSGV